MISLPLPKTFPPPPILNSFLIKLKPFKRNWQPPDRANQRELRPPPLPLTRLAHHPALKETPDISHQRQGKERSSYSRKREHQLRQSHSRSSAVNESGRLPTAADSTICIISKKDNSPGVLWDDHLLAVAKMQNQHLAPLPRFFFN